MERKKIDTQEVKAFIALLDDPCESIYANVKAEILSSDFAIIPHLQAAFQAPETNLQAQRLSEVLGQVKVEKLIFDIENWRKGQRPELIQGMLHIARYGCPGLDTEVITNLIDEMARSVRSKIEGKSPKEIAGILNQVILSDFGFNGNRKEYSALDNSFIDKTFETRKSNPIGLSIVYLLVAKASGILLVGINSPGHFILGYPAVDNGGKRALMDKIAFFIDPFNNGQIIESKHFDAWLNLHVVPEQIQDTIIATDKAIIKRVFNNLIHALYTSGEKNTAEQLLAVAESI